jgi:hypothetical protein
MEKYLPVFKKDPANGIFDASWRSGKLILAMEQA